MKNLLILTLGLIMISAVCAKDKKENNMKIVQTSILVDESSTNLEAAINKFLIEKKIKRDDLIGVQLQAHDIHKRAIIIYEIDYEEK